MRELPSTLRQRIPALRRALPIIFTLTVLLYQLVLARWVHDRLNDALHSVVDILFYGAVGSLSLTWALWWVSRWVDDKERAELRAHEVEHHLASILSTAADAILSTDGNGKIEFCNRGAEIMLGFAGEEVISQPLSVMLGGGPAAEVEARWLAEAVRREGLIHRHETTCTDITGHMIDVELTATRLTNDQGQTSGMSLILRDISHRKRREEETQRLNARLNRQAADRTHELAEKVKQLAQANAELSQLDETRSEFVSLVSHQIRAPLTNVAGAVQRMRTDCPVINLTCARMFIIVEQQVRRLNGLVQDVLSAARVEAGEMPFHCEPMSVLPVVRQAADQFHARVSSRLIRLADKPGLPLVFADRDRVSEILANLLDNADKYSPPQQAILIEARADQSDVTISVRDSGPGLPVESFERVFDKFHRADSTDAQTAYGYGLGLYVCRRLVEAQLGRIWAENHPAGGAVFSFTLPVWQT